MDLLSLSGLFRLLNIDIDSLFKVENLNVDSLVKFNVPIYIVPGGVRVDRSDGSEINNLPSAVLLPPLEGAAGFSGSSRALSFRQTNAQSETDQPQVVQLPFGQGLHYTINQRAWWESGEQITLGDTKLVPARYQEDISIVRIGPGIHQPRFRVNASPDGGIAFSPQAGAEPLTPVEPTAPWRHRSETWRFTWFDSRSTALLQDSPATVVSFDPAVASGAWLLDYERTDRPPSVRYLLVFPAD